MTFGLVLSGQAKMLHGIKQADWNDKTSVRGRKIIRGRSQFTFTDKGG